jgi:probable F420-dependent oxidoreductase
VNFAAVDPGDWSALIEFAQAADAAGFDLLSVSDHVAFGERLDVYADPSQGGTRGGVQPTGPDGLWLDPLITVTHMAAITTRVRFITTILLAALRRPVVLAKMVATLDVFSRGRLELGVGVGWQREEYEAAGLSFENRGRLLDHTIEVCQTIWRNSPASYESDELSFHKIHQAPKPVQLDGVPIWVSGTVNGRAMDRLARYGSGWIPWGHDASDVAAGIARMRTAMARRGRDPAEIGVFGSLPIVREDNDVPNLDRTMEPVARLHAAGVTIFHINFSPADRRGDLRDIFGSAVAAFRAATS